MDGAVPGFLPSANGLHFANSFPHQPVLTIDVPAAGSIPIGDAAGGLCGGMIFTAIDLFLAGCTPGPETDPPAAGSPRYQYIVNRLLTSFGLPGGTLRYFALMQPLLPDEPGPLPFMPHGRPWIMAAQEWPKIRAEIDAGRLCSLGLIRVISADPRMLGRNHQVVAYRYSVEGSAVAIGVYDPNHPNDDTVEIRLDVSNPSKTIPVTYTPGDGAVYCFFRTSYEPATPTPWMTPGE